MKAGLTLLEVLLALTLLSGLVLGLSSWLVGLSKFDRATSDQEWTRHAHAVVDLLQSDLRVGDYGMDQPKVEPHSSGIRIRGRRDDWVDFFHSESEKVVRRGSDPVPVLGRVEEFTLTSDLTGRVLRIKIESTTGSVIEEELEW